MGPSRTFLLAAHRGDMAAFPENTIGAFLRAEKAGVDELELDVRLTKDNAVVVFHDRTVDRVAATATPHLRTPVEELTLEQLQSVDLGFGQTVPTLGEVIDATSVLLQIEIKAPATARPLAGLLAGRTPTEQARCLISSFFPLPLTDFAEACPDLPRGTALLVADLTGNWHDDVVRTQVSTVLLPWTGLTRDLVNKLHSRGYRVGASLLEGPGDVRRILDLDIDATVSNTPEYARTLLTSNAEFRSKFPGFCP